MYSKSKSVSNSESKSYSDSDSEFDLQKKIPEENIFFVYTHANTDTIHMNNGKEQLYTMDIPKDVYIGDVTKSGCSMDVLPTAVDKTWIDCIKRYKLNSFVNPKESPTEAPCNYSKQTGQFYHADYWSDFKLYKPDNEYFNLALQFPLQYRAIGEIYQGEREDSGLWGIYDINGKRLDKICAIFEEEYAAGKYGKARVYPSRSAHRGIKRRVSDMDETTQARDSPHGSLELSKFIDDFKSYKKVKGPMLLFLISCRPLDTKAEELDKIKMVQEISRIEDDGLKNTGRIRHPHTRGSISTLPERRLQSRKRRRGRGRGRRRGGGYATQRSRRTSQKRVSKKNKKKKRKTRKKTRRKSKN